MINKPQVYFQNGAIYIFTIKSFLKNRSIPKTNVKPYFMSESDNGYKLKRFKK